MRIPKKSLSATATLGLAVALATVASPAQASGNTLTVNVGSVVRSVTHVAAGGLYGVDTGTSQSLLNSLHPNTFTQPPPGTQQLGNGASHPCCDALKVASEVSGAGAHEYIRMPDIFSSFPYNWVSWSDWNTKVDTMVQAVQNAGTPGAIAGWEIWNEPDGTWPSSAGSYLNGWTATYNRIRSHDSSTPIIGPGWSYYNHQRMLDFMTNAKNTNTLPDVAVWHELGDFSYQNVQAHVDDFRSIESSLGLGHRPISINEYGSPKQVDIPSIGVHYMAVFERAGVHDAERAYWYEAGTFNGLLYNNQPTASYWAYKWYADQSGNIVQTVPQSWLDGVASYDSGSKTVNVVFGGDSGTNTVQVNGLGALGSSVNVKLSRTDGTGRKTVESAPVVVSNSTYTVNNGSITVSVPNMDATFAYQLLITPAGGGSSYVKLQNRATGLYLDGVGRTANGSDAGQWSGSSSYNQQWQIVPDGSYVRLQNRATGLFLDGLGRTANGSNLGQWGDSNHPNQQWTETTTGNYVRFQNRTTGLYIDGMGRTSNGDAAGQWSSSGSYNQQWLVVTP